LISINITADMMEPPQRMKHHKKHYMKQMHGDKQLTEKQREEIMHLRMEFMERERTINRRLKQIRGNMNHCMIVKEEQDIERYRNLREEREELRREREKLKDSYREDYIEIIKKQ